MEPGFGGSGVDPCVRRSIGGFRGFAPASDFECYGRVGSPKVQPKEASGILLENVPLPLSVLLSAEASKLLENPIRDVQVARAV